MLKRGLVLGAAAAAVAAAAPLAAAPAAPTGSFTLLARLDRPTMVRVDAGRRGISGGDRIVFSAGLQRDGRPAGRAEFVQDVVDDRYQGVSMRVDLLLADGTLELQGAGVSRQPPGAQKPSAQTTMAIVGGTGSFAGASGTVRLVQAGRTTQRLVVALGD